MQIPKIVAALAILVAFSTPSFARHHHDANGNRAHRVHYAHSVLCDGIHGCTCGSTAAREAGFPRMYNGHNLWEAREWKYAFRHTSFANATHAAVEHHVVKLVGGSSCANAIVHDEKGTYPRNVCNMTFVNAGFGGTTTHSARSHRGHQAYALAEAPVDRHATH